MTSRFLLPLTFPNQLNRPGNESCDTEPTTHFQNAQPTCTKYWVTSTVLDTLPSRGIVVGCEDGTLYVFHQSSREPPSAETTPSSPSGTRQASDTKQSSRSKTSFRTRSKDPRPLSPPPILVAARSTVVSGVSAEQVEAPKNYVDFDDEPTKLKDMLMGRSAKDRASIDKTSERATSAKSPTPSILEPFSSKKDTSKMSFNPARSPTPFSGSASTRNSSSPDLSLSNDLELKCHIIPRTSGDGHCVRSLFLFVDAAICIVLQASGHLYLFSLIDGQCLACALAEVPFNRPQTSTKNHEMSREPYTWLKLQVYVIDQETYIIASGSNRGYSSSMAYDPEDVSQEMSLSVIYRLISGQEPRPLQLELLCTWELDCLAQSINIFRDSEGRDTVLYIDDNGVLLGRVLMVLPDIPTQPSPSDSESNSMHISLPNPFKIKSKSLEQLSLHEHKVNLMLELEDARELGHLPTEPALCGFSVRHVSGQVFGLAWTQVDLTVIECTRTAFKTLCRSPMEDIVHVEWLYDYRYVVVFEDRAEIYNLQLVDADNNVVEEEGVLVRLYPSFQKTVLFDGPISSVFAAATDLICITADNDKRQIQAYTWDNDETSSSASSSTLWKSGVNRSTDSTITVLLPLDVGLIIQGNADGHLRLFSLEQMCQSDCTPSTPLKMSDHPLNGYISSLHFAHNLRTKEKYIVGGADDGSVAFWMVNTLELCAKWVLFNSVLHDVVQFPEDKENPLHGCILCVSLDGAIAVVAVDGLQFLYLIPGASAKLESVCLGGYNLLLIYTDGRCRLWDIQTKEFWRSMTVDKANEMLDQGGWIRRNLSDHADSLTVWNVPALLPQIQDAASTLSLLTERFITDTISITKSISTNIDQTRAILQCLDHLRTILATLVTFGLSEDVDSICKGKLGIKNYKVSVGFSGADSTTLYNVRNGSEPWCISGNVTATRLLGIVLVLKAMSLFEEYTEAANTVIAFYLTSLVTCVGPSYKPPSFALLGSLWFEGSTELRQAIRIVIEARVSCMSDEEANSMMEHWQNHVPCLQLPSERESHTAALSLFICGYIATEKYSFIPATVLRDISKSISLYLLDEKSIYRVLSIDLCSRGFHIWQHYIDAMEILRSLFILATTSRKENISLQNVGAQARSAVLLIASNNTPLFMSTLGVDILTPPSLEHRTSVLQIVAFLIRKRPSVLQPNLPKLMEAVVKSLDPNNTTNRDAVLDTATEIIGYVVKTFPTVDFHMSTQRLAVGTHEGAVIMYDLKTAIRLFVLEGHKKAITALSFSPDGRRLVTLSMEEAVVQVWKVGSSFMGFFYPGAPPRQGNSGGQPFKTFNFNIGNEGPLTLTEALTHIRFDWTSDRSVKLKIRDSILTFSS